MGVPSPWRTTGLRLCNKQLNLGITSGDLLTCVSTPVNQTYSRELMWSINIVASDNDDRKLEALVV